MGRIVIFLLIAIGAGLYFPRSREVILGVMEPLLSPALHWTTRQELNRIADELVVSQGSTGTLPTGRGEFDAWLMRRYPNVGGRTDAWGGAYMLRTERGRFTIASAGPDGISGNDDDLTVSRSLAPSGR